MLPKLKLVSINLLIFIVLLLVLNWLAGVIARSSSAVKTIREELPAYLDKDLAYQIAADQRASKSEYMSFTGWVKVAYESETLHIDEEGERFDPATKNLTTDKPGIHFFGGSTMFGVGVEDAATIPAYCQSSLRDHVAINHGQLAYTSRQNLAKLLNLAYEGSELETVVFYDGVNEVLHLCKNVNEPLYHARTRLFMEKINPGAENSGDNFLYELFLKNFVDLRDKLNANKDLIQNNWQGEFDTAEFGYNCAMDSDKLTTVAKGLLNNWMTAKSVVESRGGRFIAILQPVSFVGSPNIDYLPYGKAEIPRKDFALALNYRKFYEIVRQEIKARNYDWIYDMSDAFDGDEAFYIDHCHVSQPGNKLIAQKITEIIQATP